MATAKQIAARKRFAAIMKSGGFPAAKKKRRKNPVVRKPARLARSGRSEDAIQGLSRARSGSVEQTNIRQSLRRAPARKTNPLHRPVGFEVYTVVKDKADRLLGTFPLKKEATDFAQSWADVHKRPVCIIGKSPRRS